MSSAFFALDADGATLQPQLEATSGWNPQHLRGPAVAGLLARTAETAMADRPELRPVRATFDLFRPSKMRPTRTRSSIVQSGRRLALVDSFLVQDDEVVARSQTLFLAAGADAPGELWHPDETCPPPADQVLGDEGRLYRSGERPWTPKADEHDNSLRKQVWQTALPVVLGEEPSAFQAAAATSDLASLVVHLGPGGLQYINADVTLSMARLPVPGGIGLAAAEHIADTGISVGVAVLFDRVGRFGTATVSALANGRSVTPRGDRTE